MKNWILTHKILSIVLACVLVAGITCAIVLPIALNKPEDGGNSGGGNTEQQTYTITFESNGGSAVKSLAAKAGEKITAPEAPLKDDFVFDGWYESADGGKTLADKAFEFSYMPACSLTLYAKWSVPTVVGKTYKVSDVKFSGTEEEKAAILDEYGIASEELLVAMYKSTGLSVFFTDNERVTVTFSMSEKPTTYALFYVIGENCNVVFYETAADKENGVVYSDGLFAAEFVMTADRKTLTMTMRFEDSTAAIALVCPLYNGGSAHTHTFDESKWVSDETAHWHAASCEHTTETKDKAAHTWNDGEITTPASCTEEGEKTYTCTVCGYVKTESVAKTAHIPSEEWSYNEGQHFHICTVCKNAVESTKVNHDESLETYGICKTCDYKQIDKILEKDASGDKYSYTTDLTVNNILYFMVTPESDDPNREWRVDVVVGGGDGAYEIEIYDSEGNEYNSTLQNGETYYVVVICTDNRNNAEIVVRNNNDM